MTNWGLSEKVFWDVRFDDIDFEKHPRFVMEKVFNYGAWNDQIVVINNHGLKKLKEEVSKNTLPPPNRSLHFKFTAKYSKQSFKCYAFKQSRQIHWD